MPRIRALKKLMLNYLRVNEINYVENHLREMKEKEKKNFLMSMMLSAKTEKDIEKILKLSNHTYHYNLMLEASRAYKRIGNQQKSQEMLRKINLIDLSIMLMQYVKTSNIASAENLLTTLKHEMVLDLFAFLNSAGQSNIPMANSVRKTYASLFQFFSSSSHLERPTVTTIPAKARVHL